MRTPLSPCCSHSTICSRNASTLDLRRRADGCRSTGSLSARATVLLLRPSSLAIWRRLFPRLCSKWTVLRSMRRNTLLPALLGWATVSGYDADPLSHFYPDICPIFSTALTDANLTTETTGADEIVYVLSSDKGLLCGQIVP